MLPFLKIPKIPGLPALGVQELPTAEVEELASQEEQEMSFGSVLPYVAVFAVFAVTVYVLTRKK
jgi:hypothetical protein